MNFHLTTIKIISYGFLNFSLSFLSNALPLQDQALHLAHKLKLGKCKLIFSFCIFLKIWHYPMWPAVLQEDWLKSITMFVQNQQSLQLLSKMFDHWCWTLIETQRFFGQTQYSALYLGLAFWNSVLLCTFSLCIRVPHIDPRSELWSLLFTIGYSLELAMRLRIMRFHADMRICGCGVPHMRIYFEYVRGLLLKYELA